MWYKLRHMDESVTLFCVNLYPQQDLLLNTPRGRCSHIGALMQMGSSRLGRQVSFRPVLHVLQRRGSGMALGPTDPRPALLGA